MTAIVPQNLQKVPLEIVGSSVFGRYPKISAQKTYNMYISDDWLIPTPGHLKVVNVDTQSQGRGIFVSSRANKMIVVIGDGVWIIDDEIKKIGREIPIGDTSERIAKKIGNIDTFTGDVFIDENDAEQIGICDKKNIYIYDYQANTFTKATIDFTPGYIAFQDGYFIAPDIRRPEWRLSALNNGLSWPAGSANVGKFETKPDNTRACVRMPGKGNQLFVMGSTVTEAWNNIGYKLFPYYRTNSFNIDYGCVNQSTIASSDKFIVWIGINEKSGPVIMASDGGPAMQISTDGINFALSQLSNPNDAYGFLYKIDGHLVYQCSFREDKTTYLYDFHTKKIFNLSDENMENHIAKDVAYFAGDYYFISFIDGDIYRLSSDITTYDHKQIPRIRVANTIRLPGNDPFTTRRMSFPLEQGHNPTLSRVDTSLSIDGGVSFGNNVDVDLNRQGLKQNKFTLWDLGYMNEFTPQFRFWGDGRFLCGNGYAEIYK